DKYVFNSVWIEVIKLTASMFKLNEPSRLGRQNTSNFINDILTVNDLYPEIFRPLNVVIQILKENTEIEFDLFVNIIDAIFKKILCKSEFEIGEAHISNREVWEFCFLLGELINAKTYE